MTLRFFATIVLQIMMAALVGCKSSAPENSGSSDLTTISPEYAESREFRKKAYKDLREFIQSIQPDDKEHSRSATEFLGLLLCVDRGFASDMVKIVSNLNDKKKSDIVNNAITRSKDRLCSLDFMHRLAAHFKRSPRIRKSLQQICLFLYGMDGGAMYLGLKDKLVPNIRASKGTIESWLKHKSQKVGTNNLKKYLADNPKEGAALDELLRSYEKHVKALSDHIISAGKRRFKTVDDQLEPLTSIHYSDRENIIQLDLDGTWANPIPLPAPVSFILDNGDQLKFELNRGAFFLFNWSNELQEDGFKMFSLEHTPKSSMGIKFFDWINKDLSALFDKPGRMYNDLGTDGLVWPPFEDKDKFTGIAASMLSETLKLSPELIDRYPEGSSSTPLSFVALTVLAASTAKMKGVPYDEIASTSVIDIMFAPILINHNDNENKKEDRGDDKQTPSSGIFKTIFDRVRLDHQRVFEFSPYESFQDLR